ncbi:MAG: hypothetical protein V1800_04180 [Candidatus Latescibacterota bacterium]
MVSEHPFGEGRVLVTTPHYLQAFDGEEPLSEGQRRFTVLLEIAKDVISHRMEACSPVKVDGPPVEYLINKAGEDLIVTLVNNEVREWKGKITTGKLDDLSGWRVWEYWEDEEVPARAQDGGLRVDVCIPPWGFKVMAFSHA